MVTAIFVTHDQEEALEMSDRNAVMQHGIVQQLAGRETIYSRPAKRVVAKFVGGWLSPDIFVTSLEQWPYGAIPIVSEREIASGSQSDEMESELAKSCRSDAQHSYRSNDA